jgi:hypothetical protein
MPCQYDPWAIRLDPFDEAMSVRNGTQATHTTTTTRQNHEFAASACSVASGIPAAELQI